MSMCFVLELFTSFWAMNHALMLSMYVLTGVFTGIISFVIKLTKYSPSLTASDRAMYSASVLEVDTVACLDTRKLRREPL